MMMHAIRFKEVIVMAEIEEKKTRRGRIPKEVVEHVRAARKERREALKTLIPEPFWTHQKAARKETLLALRSLIDAALEELEKK
jgi:hypothetical protein